MNKFIPFSICGLLSFFLQTTLFGQNFTAVYTFANVTATSGRIDPTPVPVATGITFGSYQAVGNSANNPNSGGRFNFTGWPTSPTINLGAYFEVIITPQANYGLTLNTLTFTIQRSGTGVKQFSIRSSADNYSTNLPASFTGPDYTVDANNVFKLVTTTALAVPNLKINFNNTVNYPTPDTIRLYGWDAGASTGTFSLNRAEFAGSAVLAPNAPILIPDTNFIRFPTLAPNTGSPVLQYILKGADLTGAVSVTTTAPFSVSDAPNGPFANAISLAAESVNPSRAVYVRFNPAATGSFIGSITNNSPGAAAKSITLYGQSADPAKLAFDFNTCTSTGVPADGFISYSVTGPQTFSCTTFGNVNTNGIDINGYAGGPVENEDWLISPPLNIAGLNNPVLSFYSRAQFNGPSLQLLLSTDYDGYSNPNQATWTDLQASFAPVTNEWTLTDGVVLKAYKMYPKVYLAFKYTSSPDLAATRWTLDDVSITNRLQLLSASARSLNFGETAAGSSSAAQSFVVQGFGYGNLTVSAPGGYQVSADNNTFLPAIQIPEAAALDGVPVYLRFSPSSRILKAEGRVRFTGNGLDSSLVSLTGSSYPKAETFDVGAYNLSFFGSNSSGNPTKQKISTQINNITTVFQRLNLDVIGVEEVSSDSAIGVLVSRLPGYNAILSNRWSYSFLPPDSFPPQKIGFIYNTATMQLVNQRVMFEGLYDSLRTNLKTLPGYPDSVSRFWSSGRLPYIATFNVSIGGVSKQVKIIDIHAKSSSDMGSYNRRLYDVRVLKDSLDTYYKNDNIILVGDYNDRVYGSITAGALSPYRSFVTDTANYTALTYPLDSAGRVSFITGTGLIDHIIVSNELRKNYITGSTDIEDARAYINFYNADSASDHLPIFARMTLVDQAALPVTLTSFQAVAQSSTVFVNWKTGQETNNDHFIVERSADGSVFYPIATVAGAGTTSLPRTYQVIDSSPLPGTSYYRLQQVDVDGKKTQSNTVTVKVGSQPAGPVLFPNPVKDYLHLQGDGTQAIYTVRLTTLAGKVLIETKGTLNKVNDAINQRLTSFQPGMYVISLNSAGIQTTLKFVKY